MTKILGALVFISCLPAFAQFQIFCKNNNTPAQAHKGEGRYLCSEALYFGSVCYTGNRREAIEFINKADYFNWDEEWLADAHFYGRDQISYKLYDRPNRLTVKHIISRCSAQFFRM